MATISLRATVLGLRSAPYDFKDENTGEQRTGTSHRLHLYDFATKEFTEVAVSSTYLGAVGELETGEEVVLSLGVYARGSRTTFSLAGVPSVLTKTFDVAA